MSNFKCTLKAAFFPTKPLTLNLARVFGYNLIEINMDYLVNLYCGTISSRQGVSH